MPEDWLGRAEWGSENGEVFLDAIGQGNGGVTIRAELAWWTMWGQDTKEGAFRVATAEINAFATSLASFLRIPHSKGANLGTRWSFIGRDGEPRPGH